MTADVGATATTAWHALSVEEALAAQKVEPGSGLTLAEVTARRAQYGPNRFAEQLIIPVSEVRKLVPGTSLDEVPANVAPVVAG